MAESDRDIVKVTRESLRAGLARRKRGDEVVVVLHPEVRLDDVEFEATNPGVMIRRNVLVQSPNQIFVFDKAELIDTGMATVTASGLELIRLPGM